MNRKELMDTLAMVKPAISSNDALSAMFTHYCFDGSNLFAYDGSKLGIHTPFKTDFKGGVPGRTFDDLMAHVSDDSVSLTMKPGADDGTGNLEIEAGKAIMTLSTIAVDDFVDVFKKEFLESQCQPVSVDNSALTAAVSCCLNSLGDDASKVEQTGLYFRRDGDYLVVYGFNHISLSMADVKLDGGGNNKLKLPDDGILVPGVFCKLMVEYLEGEDNTAFEVGERFVSLGSGKFNAYGTLIQQPTKMDFEKILDDNFPSADSKKLVAIPAGLKEALERACVIINTKLDGQLRTEIDVKDGVATFLSRSQRGVVDDQIEIPGHPDVRIAIDPRPVLAALPFYATTEKPGKLLFEQKCSVFSRTGQTYLVAAYQPKDGDVAMATPMHGFPNDDWFRKAVLAFRGYSQTENELRQAMVLSQRRLRFIRSLFPADWQLTVDQYSFVEGRAILIVKPPLFPR